LILKRILRKILDSVKDIRKTFISISFSFIALSY